MMTLSVRAFTYVYQRPYSPTLKKRRFAYSSYSEPIVRLKHFKIVVMASEHESVFLGIWTNWSHGSVAGLTLTTTLQNGGLLIAFLALFVTFTGTCFWSIVSFIIHQKMSRRAPQSAVYHQQQAILRNSDTSTAALWRLSRMSWTWRKVVPSDLLKTVSLPLIMSLATFFAFTTAGVFSSRVRIPFSKLYMSCALTYTSTI